MEDLRTRTPGMMPYIPFDNCITTGFTTPSETSPNGNWGGFPANIKIDDEVIIYTTLIKRYNAIKKILARGTKLKRVNSNGYYTSRFNENIERNDFAAYDVNDFTFNVKKLYYQKGQKTATEQYIILIPDKEQFDAMGGYETCAMAEQYIGILNIPTTIKGEKVPTFLYKSQVSSWIFWLQKNKDSADCCILREYERRGGDAMLEYLLEHNTPYVAPPVENLLIPTFDISLLLNQEYKDVGVLTPYDETIDFDSEVSGGLGRELITGQTFETDSKISTLRTREKKFSNDGRVLDYIGDGDIPYKEGEIFNSYLKDAETGTYVADSILDIKYYKTVDGEPVETTIEDAEYVEFDYVRYGEFTGEPVIDDDDKCTELIIDGLPADYIIYDLENQGFVSSFTVTVNDECTGWTAWVGEEDEVFLNIVDKNGNVTTATTYNTTCVPKGGYVNLGINSNTKWSISTPVSYAVVTPSAGVNDSNLTVKIEPFVLNEEISTDTTRDIVLTITYGDNYQFTKEIVITQGVGWLYVVPTEVGETGYTIPASESKHETTRTFELYSSSDWFITNPIDWCSVDKTSGPRVDEQEENEITITISPNYDSDSWERHGYLIIENEMGTIMIPIRQEVASYYVMVLGVKDPETGEIDTSDIVLDNETDTSSITLTLEVYNYNNGVLTPIEPGSSEYINEVGGWKFVSFQDENEDDITNSAYTIFPTASTASGDFIVTNTLENESEVSGYITICLGNEPETTIMSPLITLTNYVLYVASGYTYDQPNPQMWFQVNDMKFLVPPEDGGVLDMTEYVEKEGELVPVATATTRDVDVFTTVPTGWTAEIVYEPYFNIEFTGDTYSRDNTVVKFDISSNMVWEATYTYLTGFDEGAEEVGEYIYVTSSKDAYDKAPDSEKGEYSQLPVADEDSRLYVKVGDTYWKKIEYPDWCSVIPSSGRGDAKAILYIDANQYDERYCEITFKASGTTLNGVDIVYTHTLKITQEGVDSLLMLKPTVKVQDGPISSVTVLGLSTTAVTFTPSEGYTDVTVLCDGSWTAHISGNTENASNYWCRVAPMHGEGTQNITVVVNPNTSAYTQSTTGRSDYLVVTDLSKEMEETLLIQQENEYFNLIPVNGEIASATTIAGGYKVEMDYVPDMFNFRVSANTQWVVDYPDNTLGEGNWCIAIPDTTEGNQDFTIFVRDNVQRDDDFDRQVRERTAILTAHTVSNTISQIVMVHQVTGETVAPSPSVIGAPIVRFSGATIDNQDNLGLIFYWDPVSGATSYDLYFGEKNGESKRIVDSYTGTSYEVKNTSGWRVIAGITGDSTYTYIISDPVTDAQYTFGVVANSAKGTKDGQLVFNVNPTEKTYDSGQTIDTNGVLVTTNIIRGRWTDYIEYGNFMVSPAEASWSSGQSGTSVATQITVTADTGTTIQYNLSDTTNFAYSASTATITNPNGQVVGKVYPRSANTSQSSRTANLTISGTLPDSTTASAIISLTQQGGSTPPPTPTGDLAVKLINRTGVYDSLMLDTTGVTLSNSITLAITGSTEDLNQLLSVTSYSDAVKYYENNRLVSSSTITTLKSGHNVTPFNGLQMRDSWANRISINGTIGLVEIYADANNTEVNKKWVIESITPSGKSAITNPLTITQNGIRAFAWDGEKVISEDESLDAEGVQNINLCISGVNNAYVSQIVLGNQTASNITTATTSSITYNGMTIDIGYNNSDTSKIKIGAIRINENTSDESRRYEINITIAIGNTTVRTATVVLVQDGTPEEGGE